MRQQSMPVIAATLFLVGGCVNEVAESPADVANERVNATSVEAASDESQHNLHGWWCVEHGVPEEECALCDARLVSEFKSKSDWCDEHGRPDSQCFVCHPENQEKFAARFEAKFGKRPPAPK